MPRASFIDFSYESSALFETPLTALALCENVQETQSGGHELPADSGYRPTSFMSGVQAKVAASQERPLSCWETLGTVSASETAAPCPVRLKPCRATSRSCHHQELLDRPGQRGSTRKGHILRGQKQES